MTDSTRERAAKPVEIARWSELTDRTPAYALVANDMPHHHLNP